MTVKIGETHYKNIHLITGKLASRQVADIANQLKITFGIAITFEALPISVAALLSESWILTRAKIPPEAEIAILPGYYQTNLKTLEEHFNVPFFKGPNEIQDLSSWLGGKADPPVLNSWDIQIIAEINGAQSLSSEQLLLNAEKLKSEGADIIDLGCLPGTRWTEVGKAVERLKKAGYGVSIDSMDPIEIKSSCEAGADLILSVNSSNLEPVLRFAKKYQTELVVIPDKPDDFESLKANVNVVEQSGIDFRIDPILEPIGLGFAKSLSRYSLARETWPNAEIMMGIGNISELTDVDSAGVNFTLLGFCQELGIRSVLTTQVINWARSSVKEIDIARRILHYAIQKHRPPKRISEQLVCLRDDRPKRETLEAIIEISSLIKDDSFRIALTEQDIVCYGKNQTWSSSDPFKIFDQMNQEIPDQHQLSASHGFYLGFEMCKAMIAQHLHKNYVQDEALNWGHLTQNEVTHHRIEKSSRQNKSK